MNTFSRTESLLSKGLWFMILSTTLISLGQAMVKALPGIPFAQIVFTRSLISLLLCIPVVASEPTLLKGKNYSMLVIRGIIGMLSLMTFFYTIQNIPLATAVTIGNLSPIFLGIMAMVFLKEKINFYQWMGVTISFSGIFLIKGFDTRITSFELSIAIISAILSAIAHFRVRLLKEESPMTVLFYFAAVMTPLSGLLAMNSWINPSLNEWMVLITLGIVSHGGQLFLTKALKEESIGKINGIYYLGIIISILIGTFYFGEELNVMSILGMGLIMAGVLSHLFFKDREKQISVTK